MEVARSALLLLACLSAVCIAPASAEQVCTKTPADLGILLDGSNSINYVGWGRALNFTNNFVDALGLDVYRIAYAQFSTKFEKYADFKTFTTKEDLKPVILNTKQLKENTDTANAFRKLVSSGTFLEQNGRRSQYPCYLMCVTDGRPDDEASAIAAANDFEAQTGCKRILLGIGSAVTEVLIKLASSPEHVFYVKSFGSINSVMDLIVQFICKDTQTQAPPPPPTTAKPQPAPQPQTTTTTPAPPPPPPPTTTAPPPPPPPTTPAPPPPPPPTTTLAPVPPCTPKTKCLNVIFVVDGSASMTAIQFNKNRDLIKRIVSAILGEVYFALVTYGTHSYPQCALTQDKTLFAQKVDEMKFRNSSTHTDLGIESANTYASAHPECQTVIVVITDGASTYPSLTLAAANKSKDSGYLMVAIGVGPQINSAELNAIVSRPELRLDCKSYDELPALAQQLTTVACNAS